MDVFFAGSSDLLESMMVDSKSKHSNYFTKPNEPG